MDFTVVIPSRNRPALLTEAIESVLSQTHTSFNIIIVNDGSDGENEAAYKEISKKYAETVTFLNLEHTINGHGQSYAINRGVEAAQGKYVCFLDDDDVWNDNEHLSRAFSALQPTNADIYYTNQEAYLGTEKVQGPIWVEGLEKIIETHATPTSQGIYTATQKDLMKCSGFAHLNTSIVKRTLYLKIKGMDENIRYECDFDFFLRTIDAASTILFYPGITSRHNAPDPSKNVNMSTAVNMLEKLLFRSYVLDKAILFSNTPSIIEKTKAHKVTTLKKISELLSKENKHKQAYYYARQASISCADIKWIIYTLLLKINSLTK